MDTLDNNRLKALRTERGLAQIAVAVRAGCSPTVVNHVERWGYYPSAGVRARIATALGVTPADIWPAKQSDATPLIVA